MRCLTLLPVLLTPAVAAACIWDEDTLRAERLGLPGTAELIAGMVERHSEA